MASTKELPTGRPDALVPLRPQSKDRSQRVLVADLDPLRRSLVCAILRANGIAAQAAETAGEIVAATEVDTVLLSLDGPGQGLTGGCRLTS
jgi:DNA-binding response OmpR family regulator